MSSSAGVIYKQLDRTLTLAYGQTYYINVSTSNMNGSNYYETYFSGSSQYGGGNYWYFDGSYWYSISSSDLFFYTNHNDVPYDENGHGTHVSGIIAAKSNNGRGVAGVSFGAKIMPLKALDYRGVGYSADITDAIYYAADNGADIINMSLGSYGRSSAMSDAIEYAYKKGVAVLAASGNDNTTAIMYPAGYENVIGVGATTNKDTRASFSNHNSSVDVSAPGDYIYSTLPTYTVMLNTYGLSRNYDYASGTSMACPVAAGVGALTLSRNPSMSPSQLALALEQTADDLGPRGRDNDFGYGRVNAYRAVTSSSPQHTWYLAEGSTAWGFICSIGIMNPNPSDVTVKITYMTDTGEVDGGTYKVHAMSAGYADPQAILGEKDFSTKVECLEKKPIAVDRTMFFAPPGSDGTVFEGHASVGVNAPAKQWFLPEGSSSWASSAGCSSRTPTAPRQSAMLPT